MPVSTAEYNPCGWRAWLNNTTLTLGMQNVFDSDPPFVAGAFGNNYDESLADDQRPVLVRPAKEEILTELEQLIDPKQEILLSERFSLRRKSSRRFRRT